MKLSELLGDSYREGMTLEEVETALAEVELPKAEDDSEKDKTILHLKKVISEANSKTADYKKKLLAKQTEEETKAQERQEEMDRILNENKELNKKIAISENVSALVGIGYDTELANETAEALYNGEIGTVIKNMQTVLSARESQVKADVLQNTPQPPSGNGGKTITKEEIMNIKNTTERQLAMQENPELFGIEIK